MGVKLSCMELTAPHDASVVIVAKSDELKIPKRASLPSMLAAGCAAKLAAAVDCPAYSKWAQSTTPTTKTIAMAAQTDQP